MLIGSQSRDPTLNRIISQTISTNNDPLVDGHSLARIVDVRGREGMGEGLEVVRQCTLLLMIRVNTEIVCLKLERVRHRYDSQLFKARGGWLSGRYGVACSFFPSYHYLL